MSQNLNRALSGKVTRWQVQLSEYDMQYVSQKTIKGSAIANFLVGRASEDYEPINFDFFVEDFMAVSHDTKLASWVYKQHSTKG